MKRIVKRYYDGVQLTPEKKQAILTDILAAKRRSVRRWVRIAAAAVGVGGGVGVGDCPSAGS